MVGQYELILQQTPQESDPARKELLRILTENCKFTVIELDGVLSNLPVSVLCSSNPNELYVIRAALERAGARAEVLPVNGQEAASEAFKKFYVDYAADLQKILMEMDSSRVLDLANTLRLIRDQNRRIFVIGNGGSAANASHMVCDLAKQRFDDPKYSFKIMSLTDNLAWLTATANDFGYENVFVQQLKNAIEPGDLVIAISSSGNSPSILKAVEYANSCGAITWAIAGFGGGRLSRLAQHTILIPTLVGQYGPMEDVSLIIGHILTLYVYEQDRQSVERAPGPRRRG